MHIFTVEEGNPQSRRTQEQRLRVQQGLGTMEALVPSQCKMQHSDPKLEKETQSTHTGRALNARSKNCLKSRSQMLSS